MDVKRRKYMRFTWVFTMLLQLQCGQIKNNLSMVKIKIGRLIFLLGSVVMVPGMALADGINQKWFEGKSSGSFISVDFQLLQAGDDRTSLSTYKGVDGIGSVHGQNIADYSFKALEGCEAKGAVAEFIVEKEQGVLSYSDGQLYLGADAGIGCVFADSTYILELTYAIQGGSGKYKGASGSISSKVTGTVLANENPPNNQFGALHSIYKGLVKYPENNDNDNDSDDD